MKLENKNRWNKMNAYVKNELSIISFNFNQNCRKCLRMFIYTYMLNGKRIELIE